MPKFMISGVDRIKQLFGMCVLNLFLREVFILRLAIKSNASLPQWALWRILSIKFYEAELLWGFWTNDEPTWIHSFICWIWIYLIFPALEEEKVKWHSQSLCWDWKLLRLCLKIECFDRRGKFDRSCFFLRKISNPCWNSNRPDVLAKLTSKDKRNAGFSQDNASWHAYETTTNWRARSYFSLRSHSP